MDIAQSGNVGVRRRLVEANGALTVSGASYISDTIPLKACTSGILQLFWADFNGIDATAHVEGSYDGMTWNKLDGDGATLNSVEDMQLWEFLYFNVLYIRLVLTYNSVTTGMFSIAFRGEFNSSKNY